jgi:hypothetical protein
VELKVILSFKKRAMQETEIKELINILESNQKYMISSQIVYLKAVKKLLDNKGTITPLYHSLLMRLKENLEE